MTKIKAILFDCDGVLLDSEMPLRVQMHEWLKSYEGYNYTAEELMVLLRGKNAKQVVELLNSKNITMPDNFETVIIDYVIKNYPYYTSKIGNVEQMLESLTSLPKVICSNGLSKAFSKAMEVKKIEQYFKGYFGRDNTGFAKPHPGVYLEGAKFLDIPMDNCLIVEDSAGSGLESAVAAKAGVIVGFTGSGANADELINAGAHYIINDLLELPKLINKINS